MNDERTHLHEDPLPEAEDYAIISNSEVFEAEYEESKPYKITVLYPIDEEVSDNLPF